VPVVWRTAGLRDRDRAPPAPHPRPRAALAPYVVSIIHEGGVLGEALRWPVHGFPAVRRTGTVTRRDATTALSRPSGALPRPLFARMQQKESGEII